MPLDPSVINPSAAVLQSIANPPPVPTLADVQAKQLALQNARLQSQSLQMGLQEKQREIQAQQVLGQAYQNAISTDKDGNPVFNRDAITQHLAASGRGDLIPGTLEHLTATEKQYADLAKVRSDTQTANQKLAEANTDAIGMAALGVKQHGYDAQSAIGAIAYMKAHQQLDDNAATQATQQILANPTPAAIKGTIDPMIARSQKATDADTKAQEAASKKTEADTAAGRLAAEKPKLDAASLQAQVEAASPILQQAAAAGTFAQTLAGLNPDVQARFKSLGANPKPDDVRMAGLTPEQQSAAAARIEELRQGNKRLGIEGARLRVDQMNAGIDPATGQPMQYVDAQGNPMNISPIARAMASYKLPPIQARSLASAQGRALMNQVLAVRPDFDIGQYEQRYKTMQDLRPSGPLGQQQAALNTLIEHSNDLMDAADALNNKSFVPGNAAYNRVAQWMGRPEANNFNQLKQYVVGETVKLIRGGGGSEDDVKAARSTLDAANSPDQLKGAIRENFGVAGGKAKVLNEQIRDAVGDPTFNIVRPEQGAILQQRGFDPKTLKPVDTSATVSVRAPDGNTYRFKTQKDADVFKKRAGIQ